MIPTSTSVAENIFPATLNTKTGISVRCDSARIDELRAQYPALQKPGYFSERHWTSIIMDNTIPDKQILEWIDDSYDFAIKKLTKKRRTELGL